MSDKDKGAVVAIAIMITCIFASFHVVTARRVTALERIVGKEVPASMTWTNGHTYTSIVKHSANCPCVKGITNVQGNTHN